MRAEWARVADHLRLVGPDRGGFARAMNDIDVTESALVELMAELRDLPGETRHADLVSWARSEFYHPLLMMLLGWQGELAREAYRALRSDLAAETPGRRWSGINPAIGRASITRLLGVGDSPCAAYAAAPFRTWIDDDGRSWIAGAIGCPPYLDCDAAMRWQHLDIGEVVLWNPRSNEARIAGEHQTTSGFVMPDLPDQRLTIWGDCGAFFRAWAARRARAGALAMKRARGEWAHPVSEPADGNLPGGLLVGSYLHARWPYVTSTSVIAAEGVTASELHFAATRAAALPAFGNA